MAGMVSGWQLPTGTVTGDATLEVILFVVGSLIVFGLGFIGGNQR